MQANDGDADVAVNSFIGKLTNLVDENDVGLIICSQRRM